MSTERLFIGLRPLTCNFFHLMNGEPEAATISPPIRAGLAGARLVHIVCFYTDTYMM